MKGNFIKPQHVRFMKNFTDYSSSSSLICRNNVDGVVSMALLQVMSEKSDNRGMSDIICNRITMSNGNSNVSPLVHTVWPMERIPANSFYLIIGSNVDRNICTKIDRINSESVKNGHGYRFMLINTTFPKHLGKYDWVLCPDGYVTVSEIVFELVKELDKTRSDKERTQSESELRRKNWDSKNFYTLIKAAEAMALNNVNTLYGRIGIQMSLILTDLCHREVNNYIHFVAKECLRDTFLLNTCYNETQNLSTLMINCGDPEGRYAKAYNYSMRSVLQIVNRMDMVAVKCDITDLLNGTPCEGLSTYLIIGVPGSSAVAPTTMWLNSHPEVDIVIIWDYEHFGKLTFRTVKPIDLRPIANKYYGNLTKVSTAGQSSSMFRMPFKPEHLVFVGKINNKDCGFGGEFIND